MSRKIQPKEHYLGNHLLIAMPSLQDVNFDHTVSLICEHNEEGAMGFVLNRPTALPIQELFDHMDIAVTVPLDPKQVLHNGGPVQPERGFVIHSPIGEWESTLELTPEIGVTASRDILFAIANGYGPEKQLITLGYAGWGEGQLEQEFSKNNWLNVAATAELVFDTEDSILWKKSADQIGIDTTTLPAPAGHA